MRVTLKLLLLLMLAPAMAWGQMQYPEADVTFNSESGSEVTFTSVCIPQKGTDAMNYAVEGTFYAILMKGVEGFKSGQPMITGDAKRFLYAFFKDKQYMRFLAAEPIKVGEQKIAGTKQLTVRTTIKMNALLGKVRGGGVTLSPAWDDTSAAVVPGSGTQASPMQPTVIVYPYLKGVDKPDFRSMKNLLDNSPAYAYAVGEISSIFTANGYKTRDFRTALANLETNSTLNDGVQEDAKSMIVRALPGDIVVEVDLSISGDGKSSGCSINLRGIEKQTEQMLAEKSYASGKYMTNDSVALINHALKKAKGEFFDQIKTAFDRIVENGRTMAIEFNIDKSVDDWNFSDPTPETDEMFNDVLEDWLAANSYHGIYNMGTFTDKVILASINIPLWDQVRNRSYSTSRFTGELKKFLRQQLGDSYKPEITAMGQKIHITIK